MEHEDKIECMVCDYVGAPDIEAEGTEDEIWWCPGCEGCAVIILDEKEKA
jgi:hypothetical protein